MAIISDSTNITLRLGLTRRASRQELLASNMANIDTPGYQPKDLAFEGALHEAAAAMDADTLKLDRTETNHLGAGAVFIDSLGDEIVERPDTVDTLDGNGVDLDQELVRYTDNALKFTAAAEMLSRRYRILQSVLNDYRA